MKKLYTILLITVLCQTTFCQDAQNNNWQFSYVGKADNLFIVTLKNTLGCDCNVTISYAGRDTNVIVPKRSIKDIGIVIPSLEGFTVTAKVPVDCGNNRYDLLSFQAPPLTVLSVRERKPVVTPKEKNYPAIITNMLNGERRSMQAASVKQIIQSLRPGVYVIEFKGAKQKILLL